MATKDPEDDEVVELSVDDPEETSQQKRINQILSARKLVKDSVRDVHLSQLGESQKDQAVFEVVRWYVSDIEPLRQQYPACEGYWTGEEGFDEGIGTINYERRARRKKDALRRHEMSGVRYSVSQKGIELVKIEPQKAEIQGLNDFINLSSHEEVLITYRKEPSPFDTDPDLKQTKMEVGVPAEISNRAFRLANMYISDIGITVEPGEKEEDAEGRYSGLSPLDVDIPEQQNGEKEAND